MQESAPAWAARGIFEVLGALNGSEWRGDGWLVHLLARVAVAVENAVDVLERDLGGPDALEPGDEGGVAYRGGRSGHF